MTIEKIREIVEKPNYEYDHEIPDKLRSREFAKVYKKYVQQEIKPYGYELVNFNDGWCECSGFVTNGSHYVYFNSGDYRMSSPYNDIFESVLVRTAKNEKDYSGGRNNFCQLSQLGRKIDELMQKGE